MPDARVVELAAAVSAAIAAKFPGETVSDEFVTDDDIADVTGRKIYVFAGPYGETESATRTEKFRDSTLSVMVINRHTTEGPLTKAWIKEQMAFVESVWLFTGDERDEDLAEAIGNAWPHTTEVTLPYDDDLLREAKLFQSEYEVTYREVM